MSPPHPASDPAPRHDPANHRFEIVTDGLRSVVDYLPVEGGMIVTHTYVPPELRGRSIAETLTRAALDHARAQNLRVVPQCSYTARFMERHREYQDLLEGSSK